VTQEPKKKRRGIRRSIPAPFAKKEAPEEKGFGGFLRTFLRQLQRYMSTGLLVWIPLIVTIWLAWWVISNVGFGLEALIAWFVITLNEIGSQNKYLSFLLFVRYYPGLGFLFAVLLFLSTGFLTRYFVTRKMIELGERIITRLPIVSSIYTSVQQIRDTFVNREGAVFQEVVLVEFPRKGCWAVAFLTSTERGMVQNVLDDNLVSVFMPSTPNPTTGFLFYVQEDELVPLDITVEEAMKLIISAGAYQVAAKKIGARDADEPLPSDAQLDDPPQE